MKRKRLVIRLSILLVMIGVIGYALFFNFSGKRAVVDQGDQAPNFILEDMEGNAVELENLQGKGVYVTFWATYCKYCRQKMEYMRKYYDEYQKQGVEFVTINVDESRLQVERHQERYDINYPLYIDRDSLVTDAYGVVSIPATFLIDETGRVLEREIGARTEEQVVDSLEKLIPSS